MQKLKILIVEDDSLIAKDLSFLLQDWGYQTIGTVTNADDALSVFQREKPDICIVDINIDGEIDGIDLCKRLNDIQRKPIIFLSGQNGNHTIARAKSIFPAAYLLKPFDEQSLQISIDLAIHNFYSNAPNENQKEECNTLTNNEIKLKSDNFLRKGDTVFIKNNYRFVKLPLCDIYYMEADGNHTKITAKGQKIVVRLPLATAVERLADDNIVRIHRSFAINSIHVDEFDDSEVMIQGKGIPMSGVYREHFFNNFNVF